MADNQDTKGSFFTPELKKQLGHLISFTIATIMVGITNSTGAPNEEYRLVRVPLPETEKVTETERERTVAKKQN